MSASASSSQSPPSAISVVTVSQPLENQPGSGGVRPAMITAPSAGRLGSSVSRR